MPRLTAEEELNACRTEHTRLTGKVSRLARWLEKIDEVRRPMSQKFSHLWHRRDLLERRMFELERKVKHCRPSEGRKEQPVKSIEKVLAGLSKAQLDALKLLLTGVPKKPEGT